MRHLRLLRRLPARAAFTRPQRCAASRCSTPPPSSRGSRPRRRACGDELQPNFGRISAELERAAPAGDAVPRPDRLDDPLDHRVRDRASSSCTSSSTVISSPTTGPKGRSSTSSRSSTRASAPRCPRRTPSRLKREAQLRRADRRDDLHVRHLPLLVGVRRDDRDQRALRPELALGKTRSPFRYDNSTRRELLAWQIGASRAVQRHEFSFELDAPPEEVWNVFWYRGPDRPQPKDVKTRIEILHPGDEIGNGLVRHCYFPVPWWLGSRGVGQSWEWLTEVKPFESWRYDAVGKPLWSRATGWTQPRADRRRPHPRHVHRAVRGLQPDHARAVREARPRRACPATTTRSSPRSTAAWPGTGAGRPRPSRRPQETYLT